ncbi:MAG: HAMP domain-containing histidine kinase [Clostridia bacterium]|nr:HAMP domain-containing histidine kinase [Clostridia bacterium]
MIKKIKKRFILLSMLPLLLVMIIIVSTMNIVNYFALVRDADEVLAVISRDLPFEKAPGTLDRFDGVPRDSSALIRDSRFFSVRFNAEGEVEATDTSHISTVDNDTAKNYAKAVIGRDKNGFYGTYRYAITRSQDGVRVDFLDLTHQITSIRTFVISSVAVSSLAYVLVVLVVVILADRIIKPFAESYEKQKRFITDASHEIKTPVTIISANADLMEMELGENEYIDEIKMQVSNMKELISSLVYLAKMEEEERSGVWIELPLSEIVEETATSFDAPAQLRGLEIDLKVTPMLSMHGEDKSIRTLISILIDNAVKYAREGSTVEVKLMRQSKYVIFTVANATDEDLGREKLTLLFERFWRNDKSRNSAHGGHGIGLSVARAVCENHNGKIMAMAKDGVLTITATLPINS